MLAGEQMAQPYLRLRQIALVARALEPVERQLMSVLATEVCFRDPAGRVPRAAWPAAQLLPPETACRRDQGAPSWQAMAATCSSTVAVVMSRTTGHDRRANHASCSVRLRSTT